MELKKKRRNKQTAERGGQRGSREKEGENENVRKEKGNSMEKITVNVLESRGMEESEKENKERQRMRERWTNDKKRKKYR